MPSEKYLLQVDSGTRPIGIWYDMETRQLTVGGVSAARSTLETILRDYFEVDGELEPIFVQKNKIQYRVTKMKYHAFFVGVKAMREHKLGLTPVSSLGRVMI